MILSRSSVVGIDLGNTSAVICIARNQKLETLVNEEGSRRTDSLISFRNGQRLIGSKAKPEEVNNYANTLSYFKRFLGRRHDDPSLAEELKHVAFTVRKSETTDGVEFVVQYNDEEQSITPEHAVAMMLGKLRKIAEGEMGGQEMHDVVICCPPYWGDYERRLLIESAKIVGINVVRVINETTAVAAAYGLLRPPPKDARHVLFIDVGVTATNVSLVRLVEGEVRVVSTACDPHLGGRDFDLLLFDHLCSVFEKQYKLDVRKNRKATIKLKRECTRVRVVLSANSVVKYDLESFMDGVDVRGSVKRDEFEQWAAPLLARLEAPVKEALSEAKMEASVLFSVEVIGGATRMPCVQKALAAIVGRTLSFTCDSDEAAAKGACLQCALMSPSFKMAKFEIVDVVPYAVKLSWEKPPGGTGEMDSAVLYKRFSTYPAVKEVSFKNYTKPFALRVEYDDPQRHARQLNYAAVQQPILGQFQCEGMESYVEAGDPMRMKVRVRLDTHGIVTVSSAQLLKREVVETKVDEAKAAEHAAQDKAKRGADDTKCQKCEKTKKEAEVTEMLMCHECKATWCSEACRTADEKAHSQDCKPDVEMKQAPATTTTTTTTTASTTTETAPAAGAAPAAEKPQVKTRLKRIDLGVRTVPGTFLRTAKGSAISEDSLSKVVSLEKKMGDQDGVIEACVNARNQLEAYARNLRGELEYSLKDFVLEAEAEKIQSQMSEIEEWLDDQKDEDWVAARKQYEAKFAEAKKSGDPVIERKRSADAREDVSGVFSSFLSRVRAGLTELAAQRLEKAKDKDGKEQTKEVVKPAEEPKVEPKPAETPKADPMAVKCQVCPKTAKDLGKRLMRCTNCYNANYCSKEHQRQDWPAHKKICKKAPKEAAAEEPKPMDTTEDKAAKDAAKPADEKAAPADAAPTVVIHTAQEDHLQKLSDALSAAETWFNQRKAQQSQLDRLAAPVLIPSEVEAKIQSLEGQWNTLKKELNPVKKAKKEEPKAEDAAKEQGEALQIEMAPSAASDKPASGKADE